MTNWYDYFEDIIPGKINTKEILANAYNLSLKDPKILHRVIKEYGKINYNGVLGKRLVDIDIDDENLYELAEKYLPKTLSTKKGNKTNHYFYLNDENIQENSKILGVEIRVNGHVVLPPSIVDDIERKWALEKEPGSYKGIFYCVQKLLFHRYFSLLYPVDGYRSDVVLHMASLLCHSGFNGADVLDLLTECGEENNDESRDAIIQSTIDKFEAGKTTSHQNVLNYYSKENLEKFNYILNIKKVEALDWMNNNFCYIEHYNDIWDIQNGVFQKNIVNLSKFRLSEYNKVVTIGKVKKVINIIDVWAASKNKFCCKDLGFFPGEDKVVDNKLNIWIKTGCSPFDYREKEKLMINPKEGYLYPINMLLKGFFTSKDGVFNDKDYNYFIKWLAYPLINPGRKTDTAVVLYSDQHGVGKGSLAQIMGDIYGDSYVRILGNDLNKDFNDFLFKKQFIFVDEIKTNERMHTMDYIKTLITEPTFNLNRKYQPVLPLNNTMNFLMATNYDYALPITEEDRRFFVVNIVKKPSETFFINLHKWRKEENGSAAFCYYLLNNIDLSNFNPHQKAPVTKAKEEMIEVNKSDVEIILDDMWEEIPRVVTMSYLLDRIKIRHEYTKYLSSNVLSRILKKKGALRKTIPYRRSSLSIWIKDESLFFVKNDTLIKYMQKDNVIRNFNFKTEDIDI